MDYAVQSIGRAFLLLWIEDFYIRVIKTHLYSTLERKTCIILGNTIQHTLLMLSQANLTHSTPDAPVITAPIPSRH